MISEAFNSIFPKVTTILKSTCEAVEHSFTHFLEPAINGIKIVTKAFDDMGNVLHHVEDVFAPVKWALDVFKWIFDIIVKPIIDDIMNVS